MSLFLPLFSSPLPLLQVWQLCYPPQVDLFSRHSVPRREALLDDDDDPDDEPPQLYIGKHENMLYIQVGRGHNIQFRKRDGRTDVVLTGVWRDLQISLTIPPIVDNFKR